MSLKWGVMGAGGIADRRTIPEGILGTEKAELVAVQDIDAARVEEVAAKYGVASYVNEADLIADANVEAVYIATPNHLHHGQVLAAAAAGKHILCEKPLALTTAECEEMVEACRDAGVKLGINFMMRFHACHVLMKQMVDNGDLGTPVLGRAELTCWYPPIPGAFRQDPALGGGAFADMGNHCVDLLEMIFGRVRRVTCFTGNLVHDYPVEDTAVAMLEFENGAKGMVDALFNVPDAASRQAFEVYGSRGSMVTFGTIGQGSEGSIIAVLEKEDRGYDADQQREEAKSETIEPEPVNIYAAHIEAFCEAVENDTEPPINGEDGIWSHKVLEACYESAKTGRSVEVQ
ncbi:MAG: Gfo/Idh/MocA family oxidoreductase [candidate division WS1 bacterium]|nr:Gfo/Idh/MocA family oxidoreductase [candidate division WS1 bacterium]